MVKRITVDASVAVKWLVPQQPDEADVPKALALLMKVDAGQISLYQPPHFVPEVMGVISRVCPEEASGILRDLLNTEMCREESSGIYLTATELSIRLKHHLFDALYHATALHIQGAVYVTADRRYFDKARDLGQIALLAKFALPQ
jgi:predicted nucleic acid-binding protein